MMKFKVPPLLLEILPLFIPPLFPIVLTSQSFQTQHLHPVKRPRSCNKSLVPHSVPCPPSHLSTPNARHDKLQSTVHQHTTHFEQLSFLCHWRLAQKTKAQRGIDQRAQVKTVSLFQALLRIWALYSHHSSLGASGRHVKQLTHIECPLLR